MTMQELLSLAQYTSVSYFNPSIWFVIIIIKRDVHLLHLTERLLIFFRLNYIPPNLIVNWQLILKANAHLP